MDQETQQLIEKRLRELPAGLRDAIAAPDFNNTLLEIGEEFGLTPEEGDALERETLLVLLGVEHPNDFPENVEDEVGLEREKAVSVAKAVDSRIFAPKRASFLELYDEKSTEMAVEENEVTEDVPKPTPEPSQEEVVLEQQQNSEENESREESDKVRPRDPYRELPE